MIGADILIKSLLKENVDTIFGYPGGATIPLHDRLVDYPQIKHIMPRNEQGGAMAADAYFRVTGEPGVCLSTSGPGATNLVTGIANAYMDSVGMVAITCQVARPIVGTDAFQEVDILGMTQPIVKHSYFVDDLESLPRIVKEAFYLARTGRPRPVHIDVSSDILKEKADKFVYPKTINLPGYQIPDKIDKAEIKNALNLIKKAKKPLIIAGHGIVISRSESELKKLTELLGIPMVTTLLGIGVLSEKHELNLGMLGMHGFAHANFAAHNADLIIGIGIRFDDRITGKVSEFGRDAKIIHIDIDKAEIGKNTKVDVPLLGDARPILHALKKEAVKQNYKLNFQKWIKQIADWRERAEKVHKEYRKKSYNQNELIVPDIIAEINKQTKGKATITTDVGQNQMWSAQHFVFTKPEQLLSSGGLGCMGYSLPAAIGAKFGKPNDDVWALMGDGGFQMNMQELGIIMEYRLPIKIVIFNNSFLGLVRQWQELFYNKNYYSTEMVNPDFVQLAKAYNIEAYRAGNIEKSKEIIKKAMITKGPILLEFVIKEGDNVFPMVPPGKILKDTILIKQK